MAWSPRQTVDISNLEPPDKDIMQVIIVGGFGGERWSEVGIQGSLPDKIFII